MAKPRAKQKKKQFNQQSSKMEDVFKVKNNAPKKSKNIANKMKTKSVSYNSHDSITCYAHVILCYRGKRYGRDMMYWMIRLYSYINSNRMI